MKDNLELGNDVFDYSRVSLLTLSCNKSTQVHSVTTFEAQQQAQKPHKPDVQDTPAVKMSDSWIVRHVFYMSF